MPNWCENSVYLRHTSVQKIDEMENTLKMYPTEDEDVEGKFFIQYLPRPANVSDKEIRDWNNDAWGTPCEPQYISYKRENENEISIQMDTAWTPPIKFYKKLVATGWTVDALYHESGYCFCGQFTNDNNDECYDYDTDDKSTLEKIPKAVLEFTGILDELSNSDDDNEDIEE